MGLIHIAFSLISICLLVMILVIVANTQSLVKKIKNPVVSGSGSNVKKLMAVPIGCEASCGACGTDPGNYDNYVTQDQCKNKDSLSPNCKQCCKDIESTCGNDSQCFKNCTGGASNY